ncbi:(+)-neomenthol dehydrogenase-like protein isoform X2 [Tanacetum coccineum]
MERIRGMCDVLSTNGEHLDVKNPASIASLADFIKTRFGKLDILVNNAGVNGIVINDKSLNLVKPGEVGFRFIDFVLNEDVLDEVVTEFLRAAKDDLLESKGWSGPFSAYIVSKTVVNAYTRILAKKYPSCRINTVNPGFTKTDLTNYQGIYTPEEAAVGPVKLALMPDEGPTVIGLSILWSLDVKFWVWYAIMGGAWFLATLGLQLVVKQARKPKLWGVSLVPWLPSASVGINMFVSLH